MLLYIHVHMYPHEYMYIVYMYMYMIKLIHVRTFWFTTDIVDPEAVSMGYILQRCKVDKDNFEVILGI